MADYSIEIAIPNQGPPRLPYEVVSTLPNTLPEGKIVLYNGTMYRPLLASENIFFPGLPWPIVGYKSFKAYLAFNLQENLGPPTSTLVVENTVGGPFLAGQNYGPEAFWGGNNGFARFFIPDPSNLNQSEPYNLGSVFVENNHSVVWDESLLAAYTIHQVGSGIDFDVFDSNGDPNTGLLSYWQSFSFGFKVFPWSLMPVSFTLNGAVGNAANDTITYTNHGIPEMSRVTFSAWTPEGGNPVVLGGVAGLAVGLSLVATYYVRDVTQNSFKLSNSSDPNSLQRMNITLNFSAAEMRITPSEPI
jgi:hypothetical protein